jgi:hypothetical protein
VEGFCMRHFRKNDNQPLLSQTMKSSDEFSTIDFVMISHDQNDSINHVSEDPKKNILLDHSKFCLVERIKTIFLCIIISLDNESKVELIEQNLTSDSTQADPVSSEGNMLSTDRMNISTSSITFMRTGNHITNIFYQKSNSRIMIPIEIFLRNLVGCVH